MSDNPLYSKSTGLPIFLASTNKPIWGDPDKCACCGLVLTNNCTYCETNQTPANYSVRLTTLPTQCPNNYNNPPTDPSDPCWGRTIPSFSDLLNQVVVCSWQGQNFGSRRCSWEGSYTDSNGVTWNYTVALWDNDNDGLADECRVGVHYRVGDTPYYIYCGTIALDGGGTPPRPQEGHCDEIDETGVSSEIAAGDCCTNDPCGFGEEVTGYGGEADVWAGP